MKNAIIMAFILLLQACSLVHSEGDAADASSAGTGGRPGVTGGNGGGSGGKTGGSGGSFTGTGGIGGDTWMPTTWKELSKCELFLYVTHIRRQGETTWKLFNFPIAYYARFNKADSTLTLESTTCGPPCPATSSPYESINSTQREYQFEDHSKQAIGTLGADGLLTFTVDFNDGTFSFTALDNVNPEDPNGQPTEFLLGNLGCAVRPN